MFFLSQCEIEIFSLSAFLSVILAFPESSATSPPGGYPGYVSFPFGVLDMLRTLGLVALARVLAPSL